MNADTPQTESTGDRDPAAYDFKFGAIGLGVMALVPIIFRIFVCPSSGRRPGRRVSCTRRLGC
jgi:hypothetical protein